MAPIITPQGEVQRVYRGATWARRGYRGSNLFHEEVLATEEATVASTSGVTIGSTSLEQVPKPTGTQAGDMLIFMLSGSSSTDGESTAPAGFTTLVYNEYAAGGFRTMLAWKRAGNSEPSIYTFKRGAGAAARIDMLRLTGVHSSVAPSLDWTGAAGQAAPPYSFTGVAGTPASGRGLALALVSSPGDGGASEYYDWSVDGWTQAFDGDAYAYTTQAAFWRRHDSTAATPVPVFDLDSNVVGANYAVMFTVVVPSGVDVAAPPQGNVFTSSPSLGNDGPLTDARAVSYTDSAGTSSTYHRWASHLTGDGPHPLVIHLHGDGGYEYKNPDTWTSPEYMRVAKDINGLGIIPRTTDQVPADDPNYQITWWRYYHSTNWLMELIYELRGYYNIDLKRIYISGFSGGAVVTTSNVMADWPEVFEGGGAMMLGGGSAYTSAVPPTVELQQQFLMRWHVGELDDGRNTLDGYNARFYAEESEAKYRADGWDTRMTYIPGQDHLGSESHGPAALRSLVNESYAKYGLTY